MYTSNAAFKKAIYDAICICLGLAPSTTAAARTVFEAYNEPENTPRPPRTANRVYWSVTPDPGIDEVYPIYNATVVDQRQHIHQPTVHETLAYTLLVICYGTAAEENARKIRSFIYLDGKNCPRAILRAAGIYPVPRPPRPVFLHEEEGSLWRKRVDISIPLRSLDDQTAEILRNSIEISPAVILYKTT